MKRALLLLGVVVGSLVGLLLVFLWYLSVYQSGHASFGGMMGQMMGNENIGGMAFAMPSYVWAALTILFVVLLAGTVGIAYYVAFPEIRTSAYSPAEPVSPTADVKEDWNVLIRTSKPEERWVLEVLQKHGGSYLQKFVVKEAGLSRLKTHRIVSRLAERGIVSVSRSGNTNEVTLAPWARQNASQAS